MKCKEAVEEPSRSISKRLLRTGKNREEKASKTVVEQEKMQDRACSRIVKDALLCLKCIKQPQQSITRPHSYRCITSLEYQRHRLRGSCMTLKMLTYFRSNSEVFQ